VFTLPLRATPELLLLLRTQFAVAWNPRGCRCLRISIWIPRTASASDGVDRELGLTFERAFDAENVSRFGKKCLDRQNRSDPDGADYCRAFYAESVCKNTFLNFTLHSHLEPHLRILPVVVPRNLDFVYLLLPANKRTDAFSGRYSASANPS